MSALTFAGGIHPPESKHITEEKAFNNLSVPQLCYIPLLQHIGKPAKPVVEVGDTVVEGQLIGEADGFISANIHSSVPGKVVEIGNYPTVYSPNGLCVVIETEGAFGESGKQHTPGEWESLGKDEILAKIKDAGIVGMGGAAFPTQVKLNPPHEKNIDVLIINGAECEPYLTVDDMLMQTYPSEIIEGIRIALKALGIKKAYIGMENNKPKAEKILKEALRSRSLEESIEVKALKVKYPQGAEKQLIYSITRREVPSGGLPMDAGVVVQNVGTIFAIYEAVVLGKPLFERYATITGEVVKNPGNFKVRIGMKICDIIEEMGGLKEDPGKIIMGGPMCGIALDSMDVPIVKGTSGVLLLSKKQSAIEEYRSCIRCGRCVSACPSGLSPCDLGTSIERGNIDLAEELKPFDCIMCGSCTFVCPARRPISHFIKLAQDVLRKKTKK